jgi:hypothetical protein
MARENPRKRPGKRAELAAWLDRSRISRIGEAEFEQLRRDLEPVSESYLRKLLRESGAELAPMIEGVRQANLEELESSLLALLAEYQSADPGRRANIRRLVITAKDHARWAAKKPEKFAEKTEMALWLVTWLENPPVFGEWVRLRKVIIEARSIRPSEPLH